MKTSPSDGKKNLIERSSMELERSLAQFLETAASSTIKFIVSKIKDSSNKKSAKILPDILENKEKWYVKDAFAYSLTKKQEIFLDDFNLDSNTLICATTGGGKNTIIDEIIENRIKNGYSVIYITPKGDLKDIQNFKSICNSYKKKAYVLARGGQGNCSYNPLACGDITQIAQRVFNAYDWNEQYYANCNYSAILGAVKNIIEDTSRGVVSLDELAKEIKENFNTPETIDIINKLQKVCFSSFSPSLNGAPHLEEMNINKIKKEGASMIVSLSSLGMSDLSRQIGRLLTNDFMNYADERYFSGETLDHGTRERLSIVIDEFGSMATHDVINILNKGRGAGLGICAAIQTISDLESISDTFQKILISNIQNFFIGKTTLPEERDFWAKFIGTGTTQKKTFQTEDDEISPMGSIREANEYLLDPNILKEIKVGQFVICKMFPKFFLDVVKVHYRSRHSETKSAPANRSTDLPELMPDKKEREKIAEFKKSQRPQVKREIFGNDYNTK